jgi:hypothetical protein
MLGAGLPTPTKSPTEGLARRGSPDPDEIPDRRSPREDRGLTPHARQFTPHARQIVWTIVTLSLILTGLAPIEGRADDGQAEPLRIKLQLAKGPYYVGQGIVVTAGMVGEVDRPKLDPPKVSGAEVWTIETDVKPLTATGIGATIAQENLFLTRFRLVPRKAGKLDIPSVRAEADGRIGRSRPVSLTAQPPPIEDRPGTFLGGIGGLDVHTEAEPATLRVGQTIEYRIRLDGPAAWGSTIRPDVGRFDRVPLGLRIEPIRDELVPEPPSRTFAYRLRPTRAGEAVLPAILISTFDPKLGRYQTKTTSSVPIRVVAVPAFDPRSIVYRPPPVRRLSRTERGLLLLGATILAGAIVAAGWWLWRNRRRFRPKKANLWAARRFAARTTRTFDAIPPDPTEAAQRTTEALIRYLELGSGRPPGALTPAEAGRGIAELTGSSALGDRAERLLAACDRTLYGIGGDLVPNRDEARQLFRDLGTR